MYDLEEKHQFKFYLIIWCVCLHKKYFEITKFSFSPGFQRSPAAMLEICIMGSSSMKEIHTSGKKLMLNATKG